MKRFAVLLTLLFAAPAFAQDAIVLKGDVEIVKVQKRIIIEEDRWLAKKLPVNLEAPKVADADYTWTYSSGVLASEVEGSDGSKVRVTAAPLGETTAYVKIVSVKDGKLVRVRHTVVFNVGSVPIPPPDPTPDPKPPTPQPDVIPSDGPRVLVIYEATSDGELLTKEQKSELNSKEFFDYTQAKCIKENGQPAVRIWDRNVKGLENAPQWWRDAMSRPRIGDRWLIVTDGTRSYAGPLPAGGEILSKIKSVFEAK